MQQIGDIIRALKARGFTVLLVEQNFHFAATVADRHYVVEHGTVIDMIENRELAASTINSPVISAFEQSRNQGQGS